MAITENTTFAAREVSDLLFVDYASKKPFLNCDYANTSAVEMTGEPVYAYGGMGHPRRVTFYGERGGTMTIETQLATMQMYQLISGGDLSNAGKFMKREVIACETAGTLTLSVAPADEASVVVFAEADEFGAMIEGAANGTTFTATTTSAIAVGTKYIAYYLEPLTNVQNLNIKSNAFPKTVTVYANTIDKSENDELLPFKMIVYKASPQPNFSLSQANSGDPVTLTITLDLLADDQKNMLDMILEEPED